MFKKYIFPFIILISALSVSISAAFYSISGLSKLFAGASLAIIIMASALEIAKVIVASLLYQYRKTLPKLLKIYLTSAVVILILITSMGIYGFLSSAYEINSTKLKNSEAKIGLLETKKNNYNSQIILYNEEKISLTKDMNSLRLGLSNNIVQSIDPNSGQVITSISSSNRRTLENQLNQINTRYSEVNLRLDSLNIEIFKIENEIIEIGSQNTFVNELGPLKYLSNLMKVSMDKIVNVLMLIIIFVFDPLAISLIIAANFSFSQLKKSTISPLPLIPNTENSLSQPPTQSNNVVYVKPFS
jgi:hypothetical protein